MRHTQKSRSSLPGPDNITREVLPNGITLLVRENFVNPSVVITGYLEVGAEDEPREQAGLCSFTVDALERGTHRRPFAQLYEEVESIGATFGVNAGTHITTFRAKGMAEHLPLLLDILSDVLRSPAFDPQQVEKVRTEIRSFHLERAHNTRRVASLAFHELLYPQEHPYHRALSGYPETVERISRDDLVAFHHRYFTPRGMVIVVVGAVKAVDVIKAIRQAFGAWEADRPAREPLPDVLPLTERREKRLTLPDKTQSNLVLGWVGPERRHPEFIACHLTNTVLGVFGMYGRLGKSVREANGLAYYVYSQVEGGSGPTPWRIVAGVNPANVDRAVSLIQEELRRIRETRVPDEELRDSQTYITGSLPLHLEMNEGVAAALSHIERYDLGLDYYLRYRDMIMSITPEDVQAAARHWLDPERFALAVVNPEK